MEIVTIEKKTFEAMMEQFKRLTRTVDALCHESNERRMAKWLDNQDVCVILGISLRTLQTYRDNGTLPYSQIGRKMFYKPDDVEQIIQRQLSP